MIADKVAYDYVGGLRDVSHQHGLHTWLENYGHWGFPRRIPDVRRPVRRDRRRVLERRRTGRHRKPRRFVLRPYLRQDENLGRIEHLRRQFVRPLPGRDQTTRRPFLRRRYQQHAAARLHHAAGRLAPGRQRLVRQRIQPPQHLVLADRQLPHVPQARELHAATGSERSRRSLFHRRRCSEDDRHRRPGPSDRLPVRLHERRSDRKVHGRERR